MSSEYEGTWWIVAHLDYNVNTIIESTIDNLATEGIDNPFDDIDAAEHAAIQGSYDDSVWAIHEYEDGGHAGTPKLVYFLTVYEQQ